MRDLGHYCLVDLANLPAEATKIRTNKNFRPDKGEPNQFILYSDTVHELPAHSFYEVISAPADDAAVVAETAITPLFYLRADNVLYGPVCKNDPEKPQKSSGMAGMLFTLPCPDGVGAHDSLPEGCAHSGASRAYSAADAPQARPF